MKRIILLLLAAAWMILISACSQTTGGESTLLPSLKDVYLFCSHGTGGLANSVAQITEAAPNARISDNIFDCYEEEASSSQEDIQAWVESLDFSISYQEEPSYE